LKIKNRLKGYWFALTGSVKPHKNRQNSDS